MAEMTVEQIDRWQEIFKRNLRPEMREMLDELCDMARLAAAEISGLKLTVETQRIQAKSDELFIEQQTQKRVELEAQVERMRHAIGQILHDVELSDDLHDTSKTTEKTDD